MVQGAPNQLKLFEVRESLEPSSSKIHKHRLQGWCVVDTFETDLAAECWGQILSGVQLKLCPFLCVCSSLSLNRRILVEWESKVSRYTKVGDSKLSGPWRAPRTTRTTRRTLPWLPPRADTNFLHSIVGSTENSTWNVGRFNSNYCVSFCHWWCPAPAFMLFSDTEPLFVSCCLQYMCWKNIECNVLV